MSNPYGACLHCRKPFEGPSRIDRRYCGTVCRSAACQMRARDARRRLRELEAAL